jgi:hypothetical protein
LQVLGVQKGLHDCSPMRAESHVPLGTSSIVLGIYS